MKDIHSSKRYLLKVFGLQLNNSVD